MENWKITENIYDMVVDYYQSIKLEVERGGFGYNVCKSEQRLLDYINSTEAPHKCNWAEDLYFTQDVADLLDDCYNYMIANEDCIISRTKNYMQIFEFIVNCLDYILLKTDIAPNQTGNCGKSDEEITTKEDGQKVN